MWVDDLSDTELLARTLEAEAGNQGFEGMLAVASVIRNRAGSKENIRATILKPGQFSAWNSLTGFANGAQGQNMKTIEPSNNAYAAANSALGVGFQDNTGGATHYYNPDLANPTWGAQKGGKWNRIGDHVFGVPEGETVNNPIGEFGMVDLNQKATNRRFTPTSNQIAQGSPNIMSIPAGASAAAAAPGAPRGMMGQGFLNTLADPRVRQMFGTMSRTGFGKRIADMAKSEIGNNATADYLESQPGGKPYADAIRSGALTAEQAYSQWNTQANKSRNTKTVDGVLIDVDTGEIIYGEDVRSKLNNEEFQTLKSINDQLYKRIKPYLEIRDGFERIKFMFDNPSGVTDYGLAVSFAKILDPGSVAREGEVRAVQNAGAGFIARLKDAENFFKGTGTLPPKVREQIMQAAQSTYIDQLANAKKAIADAKKLADATGIPHEFISEYRLVDPGVIQSILPPDPGTENPNQDIVPKVELDANLPPTPPGIYVSLGMLEAGQTDTSKLTQDQMEEARQVWNRIWIDQGSTRQSNYLLSGGKTFGD